MIDFSITNIVFKTKVTISEISFVEKLNDRFDYHFFKIPFYKHTWYSFEKLYWYRTVCTFHGYTDILLDVNTVFP